VAAVANPHARRSRQSIVTTMKASRGSRRVVAFLYTPAHLSAHLAHLDLLVHKVLLDHKVLLVQMAATGVMVETGVMELKVLLARLEPMELKVQPVLLVLKVSLDPKD
jgi:hypothetical protein